MMHPNKNTTVLALLMVAISLSACSQGAVDKGSAEARADLNQAELCEVSAWQRDVTSEACKQGQKVVFLPQRWGNEQLPILFAAVNCDLRYSVALTNGGVACIYNPLKPLEKKQETAPDSSKP